MKNLNDILKRIGSKVSLPTCLLQVIIGIYCICSGGVTMKNIARWTEVGASYRTIQRMFGLQINWVLINIELFKIWLEDKGIVFSCSRFILAVDEVVEDKSRHSTYGIGYFYSSLIGKVCRSICSQVVSIIDVTDRKSFPLMEDQQFQKKKQKSNQQKRAQKGDKPKRKVGRPKGSKNKNKTIDDLPLYKSLDKLLSLTMKLLGLVGLIPKHLVADGKYANKNGVLTTQANGLSLTSKLNVRTNLFFLFTGKYKGVGAPPKYGKQMQRLTNKYKVETKEENGISYEIFHYPSMWTKGIPSLINVVIIRAIKPDGKTSIVKLFSTDLELEPQQIIDFYRSRFQIEFNFRDAKQFFGLADFKNTKKTQVNNAINLSFFMVNISTILIDQFKQQWQIEHLSIQDLKSVFRAHFYIDFILNYLGKEQGIILNEHQKKVIQTIGAINLEKPREKKAA